MGPKKLRPMHDRILVRRTDHAEKSDGGLFIPDSAKSKTSTGTVLSTGRGRKLDNGVVDPLWISPGDVVMFDPYGGIAVTVEGEELLMLREQEVLGVWE